MPVEPVLLRLEDSRPGTMQQCAVTVLRQFTGSLLRGSPGEPINGAWRQLADGVPRPNSHASAGGLYDSTTYAVIPSPCSSQTSTRAVRRHLARDAPFLTV